VTGLRLNHRSNEGAAAKPCKKKRPLFVDIISLILHGIGALAALIGEQLIPVIVVGGVLVAALFLIPHFKGFSFIGKNVENITVENIHYQQALDDWYYKRYDAAAENFLAAKAELERASGRQARLELAQLEQKLGKLYIDMGQYAESYNLLNSAYTTFHKLLGRRHTLTTLAQAQIAMYDLEIGNYDRAIVQLNEAYDASTKASAKLQIGKMLAQAHMEREDYAEANEIYKSLCDFWIGLGQIPLEVDQMLVNDYGCLMLAIGKYDDAYMLFQKIIEYWETNNGGENPIIGQVFANMAVACSHAEKPQEAAEYADRATAMYEKFYNGGLELAKSYQVVGGTYREIQDMEKAHEYFARALDIALAEAGEYHSFTAIMYQSLATYYNEVGDAKESIHYNEKAIEVLKAILQGDSSDAAVTYNNICDVYTQGGRYEEAINAAQKGIAICENNVNIDPAHLGHLYLNMAWPHAGLEQLDQALDCADKGIEIIKKQFDDSSPTLAWAYLTKGRICS